MIQGSALKYEGESMTSKERRYFTLMILNVEVNLAMRIDKAKLGNRALKGERIGRIIGSGAMVSEEKPRKHHNDSQSAYNC